MAKRIGRAEILRRAQVFIAERRRAVAPGAGVVAKTDELARACKVTTPTFRYHFGSIAAFRKLLNIDEVDERTVSPEAIAARDRLTREKRQRAERAVVSELKRQVAEAEERVKFAEERAEIVGYLEGRTMALPDIRVSGHAGPRPEATYFALASDWHVGERVRPSEVGWRNTYTPEIAAARAEQFFKSNLIMLSAARSAWAIPTFVLWLGGDLCTGLIHEEYKTENYLTPLEEMSLAYDLIERGIRLLLATSDCKEILVVTSNGNHGRTTIKMHAAGAFRHSYEFALYQQIARRFADETRVKFQIGEGYYNDLRVYGQIVRFSHGDGVKFSGGVGGVSVPFNRRIGREAQSAGSVLLYPHGHFHTFDPAARRLGNGSLIGWNSYAERYGFEFEAPQQASFVVDSRYKVVSNINRILVEKAKK